MTPMMNNPFVAIVSAFRRGNNPMAMLEQMAGQDPQINRAMQIMRGKSPAQLEQIARNMANERGVSVDDIARSLGVTVPSTR